MLPGEVTPRQHLGHLLRQFVKLAVDAAQLISETIESPFELLDVRQRLERGLAIGQLGQHLCLKDLPRSVIFFDLLPKPKRHDAVQIAALAVEAPSLPRKPFERLAARVERHPPVQIRLQNLIQSLPKRVRPKLGRRASIEEKDVEISNWLLRDFFAGALPLLENRRGRI